MIFDEYAIGFPLLSLVSGMAISPHVQNIDFDKTNAFDWNPEGVC